MKKTQTLDSLFELADILDDRDKYTHGHSERVGHYAEQVTVHLGLASEGAGRQWDPRVVDTFVTWADAHHARTPALALQPAV